MLADEYFSGIALVHWHNANAFFVGLPATHWLLVTRQRVSGLSNQIYSDDLLLGPSLIGLEHILVPLSRFSLLCQHSIRDTKIAYSCT